LCTTVQTLVNGHCELKENSIRDVKPVELVVQQLTRTTVELPGSTNNTRSSVQNVLKFVCDCSWCTCKNSIAVINQRVDAGMDECNHRLRVQRPRDTPKLAESIVIAWADSRHVMDHHLHPKRSHMAKRLRKSVVYIEIYFPKCAKPQRNSLLLACSPPKLHSKKHSGKITWMKPEQSGHTVTIQFQVHYLNRSGHQYTLNVSGYHTWIIQAIPEIFRLMFMINSGCPWNIQASFSWIFQGSMHENSG